MVQAPRDAFSFSLFAFIFASTNPTTATNRFCGLTKRETISDITASYLMRVIQAHLYQRIGDTT